MTLPALENLRFELADGVATLTLDRPDAQNAVNLAATRDLMRAAIECDENPAIRAVLLTGAGKIFSVGGDIREFVAAGEALAPLTKEMTAYLHAAVSRFARMDAPLIAAVNGVAAGGGFGLACAADIVLAAESARFCAAYTKSGLSPDTSSTYFLPRLVGWRRAAELFLTNRVLSAAEAAEYGLVTRVVADADLLGEASALARGLASGATGAFGSVKRLLLSSAAENLETQMEYEARLIADAARGRDAREGIAAFLEKRAPKYEGS